MYNVTGYMYNVTGYMYNVTGYRNLIFATNTGFLFPISLQPNVVEPQIFSNIRFVRSNNQRFTPSG